MTDQLPLPDRSWTACIFNGKDVEITSYPCKTKDGEVVVAFPFESDFDAGEFKRKCNEYLRTFKQEDARTVFKAMADAHGKCTLVSPTAQQLDALHKIKI